MISNKQLPSGSIVEVFSATAQTAVTTMVFCNVTTSTDTTVDVYVVPYGDNPSPGTLIMNNVSIPASETFVIDTERFILENRDRIYATAYNTSTITVTISTLVTG